MIKVFEDVVEILDPEMNIDSEIGEEEMQVEEVNCNNLHKKSRINNNTMSCIYMLVITVKEYNVPDQRWYYS